MQVRFYTPSDKDAWDSYVLNHPSSTHCHLSGWKEVIEKAYGHRAYYLIAEQCFLPDNAPNSINPMNSTNSISLIFNRPMTSPQQPAIRNKQQVNSINQKPATRNQFNPISRLPIILISIILFILFILISSSMVHAQEWWQTWDNYPKVPRITAKEVKRMMLANEQIVFVYAGYEVDQVLCGSFYIPYTKVPPSSDGASVNFNIPKDYWIMCY